MTSMYLDDERHPKTERDWFIVRTYNEALQYIVSHDCPSYISFDHDLGTEKTGYDFAKALVEFDLDSNMSYIPEDFEFNVHSANPVGRDNIRMYLTTYLEMRKRSKNG